MVTRLFQLKPAARLAALEGLRNRKMARSAHAYVRGNTLKFYDWLTNCDQSAVPQGPAIWICGDCHLGNLGPVADLKGKVEIAIRDLDQTVIGNPAHDLIRLALSMATAARGSDLPGVTTAHILEDMIEGYKEALDDPRDAEKQGKATKPVQMVMREALKRKWRHLANERIEDVKPKIPLGEKFWPLSKAERTEISRLFKTDDARAIVTGRHGRKDDSEIEVADAAYWVKGCSSLGRLRFAVLLRVGHKDYCLFDMKEAAKAAAPHAADAKMPRNDALRVVHGAQELSPFLGERMLAADFLGRHMVIRELLPQDLKLEMDRITCEDARKTARFLASVIGKAHARQMDSATRAQWHSLLVRGQTKDLDAPSWLWTSIVELISSHEVGYLEHCRQFALAGSREN